jgi:hypothetical protein
MKLADLSLRLPDVPRHVAISSVGIVASIVLFAALYFTIGTSLVQAKADNTRLKSAIAQASKSIEQVNQDYAFVTENLQRFEALLQGERLVPHTRRDATERLQELAKQYGVSSLNWTITPFGDLSVATATSQSKSLGYRVNAESIALKIGAPLDGQIYKFVSALTRDFPGGGCDQQHGTGKNRQGHRRSARTSFTGRQPREW